MNLDRGTGNQANIGKRRLQLVIVTVAFLFFVVSILAISEGAILKRLRRIELDTLVPQSLNENGLWGPKINHERMLLQIEKQFINLSSEDESKGLVNARWLDLGSALFYSQDEVELHAKDHVLLMLYAAEANDQALFDNMQDRINSLFLRADGLLKQGLQAKASNTGDYVQADQRERLADQVEEIIGADRTVWLHEDLEQVDYYSSLIYMRALGLAYQRFGDKEYLDFLKDAAQSYLEDSVDGLPPVHPRVKHITPTPPVFVDEEGLLDSSQTDVNDQLVSEISLIHLAEIDLFTLSMLRDIDEGFNKLYENSVDLLLGASRDDLAVFAEAFDPETGQYIHYVDEAEIKLSQQLIIMMNLAEVDLLAESSRAWIRSRLNNRDLVETYSLQDVTMTSTETLPLRYGQVSRLARILGDQELYRVALDRILERNLSSVSQSPIFGLVFRSHWSEEDVQIATIDNIWALLGSH